LPRRRRGARHGGLLGDARAAWRWHPHLLLRMASSHLACPWCLMRLASCTGNSWSATAAMSQGPP
jgi:hypothetical protein